MNAPRPPASDLDDEMLTFWFSFVTAGQERLTRRMVISLADADGTHPMAVVRRLEHMELVPAGTERHIRSLGGITAAHIAEIRAEVA